MSPGFYLAQVKIISLAQTVGTNNSRSNGLLFFWSKLLPPLKRPPAIMIWAEKKAHEPGSRKASLTESA